MRFGDAAPMAVIELVDRNVEEKNQDVPKKTQTEEVKNDKRKKSKISVSGKILDLFQNRVPARSVSHEAVSHEALLYLI